MELELSVWSLAGALGFWLIEASYMMQIVRLHRRKAAEDISVLFPSLNLSGRLLATAYAMHAGQGVFMLGFLTGAALRLVFMLQVFAYRRGHPTASPTSPHPITTPARAEAA